MALRVSLPEEHCRYLFSPGKDPSTYTWRALLASLGLEIPEEIGLDGLVARGWLKPLMRIKLPRTFYSNWISFPTYPVTGKSRPEDEWARDLWSLCTFSLSTSRTVSEGRLLGKWYRHVLDQPHDPLTRQVKPHLLATGPDNTEPPPISHRRFGRVSPWVDLFAYWQAYQLADVLSIIQRRIVLLYGTDQRPLLKQYLRSNARRDELVEKRLGRIRERWELNARVFDWVSRYRTLRELWLTHWHSRRQPAWGGVGWVVQRLKRRWSSFSRLSLRSRRSDGKAAWCVQRVRCRPSSECKREGATRKLVPRSRSTAAGRSTRPRCAARSRIPSSPVIRIPRALATERAALSSKTTRSAATSRASWITARSPRCKPATAESGSPFASRI